MANIILYNSNEIVPAIGGVERVAKIMYDGLVANGHNVSILFYNEHDGNDKPSNQFKISSVNAINFIQEFINKNNTQLAINLCGLYNTTSATLIEACKKEKIKVVSVFHNSFDSLLWSNPQIQKLMNYNLLRNFFRRLLALVERLPFFKEGRYVYNNSDKIVLLSDSCIDEYKFFINRRADKVISIHNPMPFRADTITWEEKENSILFVGRLDHQKGLDKLLRIWAKANSPDWSLNIVGDGPMRQELESLALRLGISNNTHFCGHRNPISYYQKAKIFAMTSLYEGFPMVLIESMAYGCVPIAFDSYPAACEIIKDRGYLIEAFDEDIYWQQLSYLISHSAELRIKSANCIDYTMKFSPDIIIKKWENLIQNLVNPI